MRMEAKYGMSTRKSTIVEIAEQKYMKEGGSSSDSSSE